MERSVFCNLTMELIGISTIPATAWHAKSRRGDFQKFAILHPNILPR